MDSAEVKEEAVDVGDGGFDDMKMSSDAQTYVLQQQQLPYTTPSKVRPAEENNETEEIPPKRPRRASAIKALEHMGSEEEDDPDYDGDNYTKAESDDSEKDEDDDEDETYREGPSTSMDDQPGTSGMTKGSTETPRRNRRNLKREVQSNDEDCEWIQGKPIKNGTRKKPRTNVMWTCKKCQESFNTPKLLRDHKKMHIRENSPTTQALINYKFDEVLDLYVCDFCSAECQEEDEIKKHLNDNHLTKFNCNKCQQSFTGPYKFSIHNQKHNGGDFLCPLCSYKTPKMICMQSHINRIHLQKFLYKCKTCGKGFNDQAIFREHDNEHLGIKPFTCVVCNRSFVFSKYMFAHQVRYHVVNIEGKLQNNQCVICMRMFAKYTTLEKHMKNHHENYGAPREKKLLCDICGQGFSRKYRLKIHYRIHTGVKPYACSYCPKSFIKKEYLVMHERVHNGERPFSCEYCGKCFNQKAHLRIHLRGHTGERPYLCQICEQGFISNSSLNFHRKNCCGQ